MTTALVIGRHVPYVTSWTSETNPPRPRIIVRPDGCGIGYADETMTDRDKQGVLWSRVPFTPGVGKPVFGAVHSLRQRRAMRRLLCQVCGQPADHISTGVLWMLRDYRHDWDSWPAGMGVTEPPICRACATHSAQACPALRRGYVLVRVAAHPVVGVHGIIYHPDSQLRPDIATREFHDPLIRWTVAHSS
ncbi:hypothetical protein [Actinokineospora enzanensis]|uniref:hypothetical protein n=1 Tax=Actinokineospora enzanensis TaxID=155975 RepID=UPI000374029B|nr:hypothetical protein [Actinokineospora enzanensis]